MWGRRLRSRLGSLEPRVSERPRISHTVDLRNRSVTIALIASIVRAKKLGSGTEDVESAEYARVTSSKLTWLVEVPEAPNSIRISSPTLDEKAAESNVKLNLTKSPAPGAPGIPEARTALVEASNNWML